MDNVPNPLTTPIIYNGRAGQRRRIKGYSPGTVDSLVAEHNALMAESRPLIRKIPEGGPEWHLKWMTCFREHLSV